MQIYLFTYWILFLKCIHTEDSQTWQLTETWFRVALGSIQAMKHHSMLFDGVTRLDRQHSGHSFKQNSNACLKSDPQLFWHNLFWEALDKSHRFLWDILLKPFWSRPTVALPQRMGQHYSASSFWSSAYNKPCNPQLSGHRERAGTECSCHMLQMGLAKTQRPGGNMEGASKTCITFVKFSSVLQNYSFGIGNYLMIQQFCKCNKYVICKHLFIYVFMHLFLFVSWKLWSCKCMDL